MTARVLLLGGLTTSWLEVGSSALAGADNEHTGAVTRRVNWFVPTGGVVPSVDGLNNSRWAAAHRDAITGYYYCCACWAVCPHPSDPADALACKGKPNGTFVNTGRCPGRSGYSAGGPPWPGGDGIPPGTRPAGGRWPLLAQETPSRLRPCRRLSRLPPLQVLLRGLCGGRLGARARAGGHERGREREREREHVRGRGRVQQHATQRAQQRAPPPCCAR